MDFRFDSLLDKLGLNFSNPLANFRMPDFRLPSFKLPSLFGGREKLEPAPAVVRSVIVTQPTELSVGKIIRRWNHMRCPECNGRIIKATGYLDKKKECTHCGHVFS